jgi:glycerol-3-phosphate O-acyltransferase / dihydroxyacetone phosphate acyltransferase
MLYRILTILFYLTTKAYFRSITVYGKKFLPKKDKPVIFAANHPSAFMDPIMLAAQINRSLYFLARGDVFKKKFLRPILSQLHMLPVYKSDVSPDQMHKNESTFAKCYDHLSINKAILIFPEGISKTERRLREIKTGVARIALGAEGKNDFKLGLTVVPIGLNYSNPHIFKGDVLLNFGKPILVSDYRDAYLKDPREAVVQLTERIKSDLEKQTVVIENEQLERTIKHIETLYRSTLRLEDSTKEKGTQDFRLSQDIVKAVHYFAEHEPAVVKSFEGKINSYVRELKRSQLRDSQIRSSSIRLDVLRRIAYFIFGFPLFLFGYVFNFIPFKLAALISRKVKARPDFVGAVNIAVGLFIFLIVYIIQGFIIASFSNTLVAVVFCLSFYPVGFFTVAYIKTYYRFRGSIKYLGLFMRKSDLVAGLKAKRKELIEELEKRKGEYLRQVES